MLFRSPTYFARQLSIRPLMLVQFDRAPHRVQTLPGELQPIRRVGKQSKRNTRGLHVLFAEAAIVQVVQRSSSIHWQSPMTRRKFGRRQAGAEISLRSFITMLSHARSTLDSTVCIPLYKITASNTKRLERGLRGSRYP